MILATLTEIPGRPVGRVLGLVVGCVPFYGTTYGEGIKDLKGNTHPDVPAVLERRRSEAVARMVGHAREMGADAVLGVAFTHRDITQAWKELTVYGTAVTLTPPRVATRRPGGQLRDPAGKADLNT